jgi:hypothetical protein
LWLREESSLLRVFFLCLLCFWVLLGLQNTLLKV